MRSADLTATPFADDEFDIVICSHVLEHVPDDAKAMREIRRILKPGGHALLLTPLATDGLGTEEDPSIHDPEEQDRRFGQWDHVRIYDRDDFLARMRAAGLETTAFAPFEAFPEAAAELGLNPLEILPVGTKPADSAAELMPAPERPGRDRPRGPRSRDRPCVGPAISVVIPHLNQPGPLAACLASLAAQAGRAGLRDPRRRQRLGRRRRRALCERLGARLLAEPVPGPGPARSRGAAAAAGGILAFIDADGIADRDWLAAIARRHGAGKPDRRGRRDRRRRPHRRGRGRTG